MKARIRAKQGDTILYSFPKDHGAIGLDGTQWLVKVAAILSDGYGVYPYYFGFVNQDVVPFEMAIIFPDRDGLALTTPEE